jgi:hypothetical protein
MQEITSVMIAKKLLHWPPGASVTVLAGSMLVGMARTAPDPGASKLEG